MITFSPWHPTKEWPAFRFFYTRLSLLSLSLLLSVLLSEITHELPVNGQTCKYDEISVLTLTSFLFSPCFSFQQVTTVLSVSHLTFDTIGLDFGICLILKSSNIFNLVKKSIKFVFRVTVSPWIIRYILSLSHTCSRSIGNTKLTYYQLPQIHLC